MTFLNQWSKELISKQHSNRQAHNWLVYDIGERFLTKNAPLYKGTLYDLGCGESPYKEFFMQYAEQYIGVDWAGSIHDTKADIAADLNKPLPIDNAVADTVISFSVMEHLNEPQTMLNEAFRILTPNGYIVLQVPFMWQVHEAPYDFFRFTRYGLEYLFTKAGFTDIEVEATSGFWTMWLLKINYQSTRLIRGPRPLRWLIKVLLIPFWWLNQFVAPLLDHYWSSEGETAGYFVTARKP